MAVIVRRSSSRLLPLVRYGRRPLVRQSGLLNEAREARESIKQNGSSRGARPQHQGRADGAERHRRAAPTGDTVGVTLDEFLGGKGLVCREVALASWTDVNADDPDMCPVLHVGDRAFESMHQNEHRRAQA
uniref:Uncharacterized protein n=1 Tax=Oryza nivara TaxID=4536 RepID=A0A0E0H0W4_ORYNI